MAGVDVPDHLRRTLVDPAEWLTSARWLLELIARRLGRDDLSDVSILDVGCGTKISKVLVEDQVPVRRYVGIDVSAEVVDLLTASVDDPRFTYHHLDAHNERYNPTGTPLAEMEALPVLGETFDVIVLFSVFTHLAPHDYGAMLRLLRPLVRPEGRLLYSLYLRTPKDVDFSAEAVWTRALDERLAHDPGAREAFQSAMAEGLEHDDGARRAFEVAMAEALVRDDGARQAFEAAIADAIVRDDGARQALEAALAERLASVDGTTGAEVGAPSVTDPAHRQQLEAALREHLARDDAGRLAETSGGGSITDTDEEPPDFEDFLPDNPLAVALYSRAYALELIGGTGWEVEGVFEPEGFIQHHILCRPAP